MGGQTAVAHPGLEKMRVGLKERKAWWVAGKIATRRWKVRSGLHELWMKDGVLLRRTEENGPRMGLGPLLVERRKTELEEDGLQVGPGLRLVERL